MSSNTQDLNELLECAIREKGAIGHMAELDRRERVLRRRRLQYFAYGVAACIAVIACVNISLSSTARKAGYAFDPTFGQMGGSEITALMQEKKIDDAMLKIDEAIANLDVEIPSPSSQDPEYAQQLKNDREELDFLDAVCLMRKGKYFKAKKALRAIADSNGAYTTEAKSLLEEL